MKRCNPILIAAACLISISSFATHMRGGQISVRMIKGFLGEIKLTLYVNTESTVPAGGANTDILYIWGSSGSPVGFPIPEIAKNAVLPTGASYTVIDAERHIAVVGYVMQHTFRE